MDVLNIYSQRLGKNMPPRLATRLHATETDTCASQTELSCPPSKSVSLQTKLRLKTSASQTELPSPKPPSPKILSLGVSTQTDIVASTKNDNLEVSNAPLMGGSGHQQQPVSKPEEIETAVNAPSDGPTVIAGSPPKVNLDSEMEEQKKRELIATLKAMDAQKDPPASQPITSTADTKSAAQPTSNVLVGVGGERPPVRKLTKQSTQPPTTSQPAKIDNDEEAKKKKLLLAKLMAIDEGSNPNKVTMSKTDVSKAQLPPPSKHPVSGHQSTTSIQSWPETVENMYQGKPAFATDDDPFGSRHVSGKKAAPTKSRDFFLTEGGGGEVESSSSSSSPKNRRLGRRHQLEQKKSSTLDFTTDNSSVKADSGPGGGNKVVAKAAEHEGSPVAPTAPLGYQPTFGRRAGAAQANKQKPKNGMIFGDFDNLEPSVGAKKKTEPPSSLEFNFEASESKSTAGSTGRDYPWETRVNVSSNPQGATERERLEKERRDSSKSDGGPLASPSMVFGHVGQEKPLLALQSRSKGSLLPLREKAGPGSAMPLDVAEPDDLEELAL
jgi:hypothetical protein